MPSNIQHAVKDGRLVWLSEIERGEQNLTCYTCGDKLVCKAGGGAFVSGNGPRNRAKGKHLSHTSNSRCHGEGPAHYRLKTTLCAAINDALEMPQSSRNFHGTMHYLCPDHEYGPHDMIKNAPGQDIVNRPLPAMERGYHHYDLLAASWDRWSKRQLDRAECEVRLGEGKTRADIAGMDADGNVLWVIEIKRTTLSQAAVRHAEAEGYPLFVIDITDLPTPQTDDPMAEINAMGYYIMGENLVRGFYPSAVESYNTRCKRKEFGMGPEDTNWRKEYTYVCRGVMNCEGYGCPDCEKVLLHECGGGVDAMVCPDWEYIFKHGITRAQMYTDPVHSVHSHTAANSK